MSSFYIYMIFSLCLIYALKERLHNDFESSDIIQEDWQYKYISRHVLDPHQSASLAIPIPHYYLLETLSFLFLFLFPLFF
jgi:hypothetical protein